MTKQVSQEEQEQLQSLRAQWAVLISCGVRVKLVDGIPSGEMEIHPDFRKRMNNSLPRIFDLKEKTLCDDAINKMAQCLRDYFLPEKQDFVFDGNLTYFLKSLALVGRLEDLLSDEDILRWRKDLEENGIYENTKKLIMEFYD